MTKVNENLEKIELSRVLKIKSLKKRDAQKNYSASKKECKALAKRFNLVSLDFLIGDLRFLPKQNGNILV